MWRRGHCGSSGRERHTHERTPTLPHAENVHGKRGRVGGRSGCGAEVTAVAVGESDTRTNGRPHCHTLRTAHGDRLQWVGCTADLQAITAHWEDSTAANRLRYYLTATGHGRSPWVCHKTQGTGADGDSYICNSCLCNLFTNVNSHL